MVSKNVHSFTVIHTCRLLLVSAEAFSQVIYLFFPTRAANWEDSHVQCEMLQTF